MGDIEETAEWLTERETIEATIIRGDEEHPIRVRDITRDELAAIEDRSHGGAEEEDEAIRAVIREYLVEPDVDPDEMMMRKRQAVFVAIQDAWSGREEIEAAMEEMSLPGNRE
jgi:hypothetical protein